MPLLSLRRRTATPDLPPLLAAQVDAGLAGEDQLYLKECADLGDHRINGYRLYEDYYGGDQRTQLTKRAKTYLEASGLPFSENFCETIVDVRVNRMKIAGFRVEDNEKASDWLTRKAWGQRGQVLQGIVHANTLMKGDAFVIVDYDEDRGLPRFTYKRPDQIKPIYDEDNPDILVCLVFKWPSRTVSPTNPDGRLITRMNLYYPDRIERWFSADADGEIWAPHLDNGDETWPEWNTTTRLEGGDPLGIPVFHFRHKPLGRMFGRSFLRNMLPQQDALNKQLLDLFAAMDSQGWQWPWMTGVSEGDAVKMAIGDVIRLANKDAKIGALNAIDPTPALEAVAATLRRIAARSHTPLHMLMLGGTLPTGESMKTAEAPLTFSVEDEEVDVGATWAAAHAYGLKLQAAFGDLPFEVEDDAEITTLWESAASRNEVSEITVAGQKYDLGVSKKTLLRELGYDPDEEAKSRRTEEATVGPPSPITPPPNVDEDPLDNET